MINSSHITLAILMMAIITFSVRYLFFSQLLKLKLNPRIEKLLLFTAPCILTAMLTPIVFQASIDNNTATNLLLSSHFWAGLITIALSFIIRKTLVVIILSMTAFYALRFVGLQ